MKNKNKNLSPIAQCYKNIEILSNEVEQAENSGKIMLVNKYKAEIALEREKLRLLHEQKNAILEREWLDFAIKENYTEILEVIPHATVELSSHSIFSNHSNVGQSHQVEMPKP